MLVDSNDVEVKRLSDEARERPERWLRFNPMPYVNIQKK